MPFLLDVNVLIARSDPNHQFHHRVSVWLLSIKQESLLFCPITESGFLRIYGNPVYPNGPGSLMRQSAADAKADDEQVDLFADFNGIPEWADKTEFYQHDGKWQNRMILGDSLHIMASLAERKGLRGKVQCIYLDPPCGIKFNSNFQWSTTSHDVKDGNMDHIAREPEQVKAFRDTWREGIHSYLTYLRDRLTVARELLTDSWSIFVQIGDENVHRVRAVMDEVSGDDNLVAQIAIVKTTSTTSQYLAGTCDYLLWFSKNSILLKYRQVFIEKEAGKTGAALYNRVQSPDGEMVRPLIKSEDFERDFRFKGWHLVTSDNITSQSGGETTRQPIIFRSQLYLPGTGGWKTNTCSMDRLVKFTHGRRPKNYRKRQPFCDLWRTRHYDPQCRQWRDPGQSQRRGCLPPTNRRNPQRRPRRHCLLVHRH